MKRFLSLFLVLALLACPLTRPRAEAARALLPATVYDYENDCPGEEQSLPQVRLFFDGAPISGEMPAVIVGGRTMAPLRLLAEALGAQVEWLPDQAAQVRVTDATRVIDLTLGSPTALVNGEEQPLPDGVPAAIITYNEQGYTMVPLRFFSETLGCRVGWDQGSFTASIFSGAYIEPLLAGLDEPLAAQEHIIAIDAGHGGSASGAHYEDIAEKDLTLSMSKKLQSILSALGYNTVMTRWDDRFVDLNERAGIANNANADVFVSIHCNAAAQQPSNFEGLYVYHHPDSWQGQLFAQRVQLTACAFTGAVDRHINSADFVVLRETQMPAILVETGFMTCHEELLRLADDAYQTEMARGIAQGMIQYLNARQKKL